MFGKIVIDGKLSGTNTLKTEKFIDTLKLLKKTKSAQNLPTEIKIIYCRVPLTLNIERNCRKTSIRCRRGSCATERFPRNSSRPPRGCGWEKLGFFPGNLLRAADLLRGPSCAP